MFNVNSTRQFGLFLARAGSVLFALTVLGYLVVEAHRDARPEPIKPEISTPKPATEPPVVGGEMYLRSSKSALVPAPRNNAGALDPTYLLGSKSAPIDPRYLPSSKIGVIRQPGKPKQKSGAQR